MKTILIFIAGLLLNTSNAFSDGFEMKVMIKTSSASGWEINWIAVKQISIGFVHYDGRLRPMTEETEYNDFNAQISDTTMILGAAYNDNTNPLTDGIFGYGLYRVVVKKDGFVKGTCYIDTRDCNYGYDSIGRRATNYDGYSEQDFNLNFTPGVSGSPGTFNFSYRTQGTSLGKAIVDNDTARLWSVAVKPRSIQFFQNFRFQNNSSNSIEVKVGNANYLVNSSQPLFAALGSSTYSVVVQNRIRLTPPPYPDLYLNFSS